MIDESDKWTGGSLLTGFSLILKEKKKQNFDHALYHVELEINTNAMCTKYTRYLICLIYFV